MVLTMAVRRCRATWGLRSFQTSFSAVVAGDAGLFADSDAGRITDFGGGGGDVEPDADLAAAQAFAQEMEGALEIGSLST